MASWAPRWRAVPRVQDSLSERWEFSDPGPKSRLMGDARDRLIERVQDTAQDTSEKVKRVASEATSAAKEAAQEEKLTT